MPSSVLRGASRKCCGPSAEKPEEFTENFDCFICSFLLPSISLLWDQSLGKKLSMLTFWSALAMAWRAPFSTWFLIFPRFLFTTRLIIHFASQLKTGDAPVKRVTFTPPIEPKLKFCRVACPLLIAIRILHAMLSTFAEMLPLKRKRARYLYRPSPVIRFMPRLASMAKFPLPRSVRVAGPVRVRPSNP